MHIVDDSSSSYQSATRSVGPMHHCRAPDPSQVPSELQDSTEEEEEENELDSEFDNDDSEFNFQLPSATSD